MNATLARLPPPSFAVVMATGIVAVAAHQQGFGVLAWVFFGAAALAWLALALLAWTATALLRLAAWRAGRAAAAA